MKKWSMILVVVFALVILLVWYFLKNSYQAQSSTDSNQSPLRSIYGY